MAGVFTKKQGQISTIMPLEKYCSKCKTTKSANEFSIVKRSYKDRKYTYLQSNCKPCVAQNAQRLSYSHTQARAKQWNSMGGPLPWNYIKNTSTQNQHKEYPLCNNGHKYAGTQCFPCKYQLPVTLAKSTHRTIELS